MSADAETTRAAAETLCALPDCNTPGTKRCSKCKVVKYCSRECQVAHWKTHKTECGGGGSKSKSKSKTTKKPAGAAPAGWTPLTLEDLMATQSMLAAQKAVADAVLANDVQQLQSVALGSAEGQLAYAMLNTDSPSARDFFTAGQMFAQRNEFDAAIVCFERALALVGKPTASTMPVLLSTHCNFATAAGARTWVPDAVRRSQVITHTDHVLRAAVTSPAIVGKIVPPHVLSMLKNNLAGVLVEQAIADAGYSDARTHQVGVTVKDTASIERALSLYNDAVAEAEAAGMPEDNPGMFHHIASSAAQCVVFLAQNGVASPDQIATAIAALEEAFAWYHAQGHGELAQTARQYCLALSAAAS